MDEANCKETRLGIDTTKAGKTKKELNWTCPRFVLLCPRFVLLLGGGDFEPAANGKKMPTTGAAGKSGDWNMQDVNEKPAKSGGDWAIDDVDSEKKKEGQFQFSNPTKPKTSGSDGWAIEDAGAKPLLKKAKLKTTTGLSKIQIRKSNKNGAPCLGGRP